ncbi:phosphate ABC transporter substrate-binding protein, PhoT family [Mucilaginibacter lappiensis]|uniref:Phosphate transport system substrate-binding protein n=1 Tax=Mucilaginibacter lappiensis TaxID=354630 RepID=A0ABR6PNV8_9SPHI|nr:substrate-binding domain-containing protein [Mucilaginibacter lappiensis]MBB6111430.1 phosphate transport system substrate-binding protein [Mucilaginibacter lappiensis]SIR79089.1 phosphate ABC transporter substrate-binding protein, PhoT family [Mucilaginibacter lappiensis]
MKINFNGKLLFFALFLIGGLQACKQKPAKIHTDNDLKSGSATFVADASFSPILDQELYIYSASNPNAKINVLYKTENAAVNSLLNDSVRVAILSRELTADERAVLTKRTLAIETLRFAIDAVALIVNKASNDTTITVGELKKLLTGQGDLNKTIVFDNPNSSLVRYLKDFSGSKGFTQKNIYALKSNKEVLKYVSEHPDALGITGFSWLNDPDKDYAGYVEKVKIVGVRDESNKQYPDTYFKPSQESLVLKQYPLSRGLYIINCTSKVGLAMGFANFLGSQVGQRIILKSGLLPDSIPTREISIKNKF